MPSLYWASLVEDTSHVLSQLLAGGLSASCATPQGGGSGSLCLVPPDFTPRAFPLADRAVCPVAVINHSRVDDKI